MLHHGDTINKSGIRNSTGKMTHLLQQINCRKEKKDGEEIYKFKNVLKDIPTNCNGCNLPGH